MLYFTTSLTHFIYYFVWRFPSNFIKFSKYLNCNPVNLLYRLCLIQKVLQAYFIYKDANDNNRIIPYINTINLFKLSLLIFGQILNLSVYYKLGVVGVYYGNKLGFKTNWIFSFPFNYFSNPQYLGCIFTLCGLFGLIDLPYLLYSTSLYHITSYVESNDYVLINN